MLEEGVPVRRLITAAILAATLVALVAPATPASAHHRRGPCSIHWRHPGHVARTVDAVQDLVRCAARRFGFSSSTALAIASRESSYRPWAYNATGCNGAGCAGVYQHHLAYWPGRTDLLRPAWDVGDSPYNARANVLVTARMVARGGWGPWGG